MACNESDAWPVGPSKPQLLTTMDGGVQIAAALERPDRYAFFHKAEDALQAIPRGAGFSFAAASFGADVISIDLRSFDRVLDFDSLSGHIEVEAGISLGALFEFLTPRGYYLPVQPGHHRITVGGCIAANVHGKNPARDGTFVTQVESLRLFHPRHGCLELSPAKEPTLFHATCGGVGLTGIIISARLRAQRLPSTSLCVAHHQVATIAEGASLLREQSAHRDLTYAWFDCARFGHTFGRGVVVTGEFASGQRGAPAVKLPPSRFSPETRARLPFTQLNPVSVRLINAAYSRSLCRSNQTNVPLAKALYPTRASELFLSLFGRRGFHECQAIIPHDKVTAYVEQVRERASHGRVCIALAVAKPFDGKSELVRFDGSGVSFAIEVPRTAAAAQFMREIDRLVVQLGGRPNLIKDSRLPREIFEATYLDCDRFRSVLRQWDPQRVFRSELSERLGL